MVEFIKIRGKEYPVRISYYASKHTKRETGKSIEEGDTNIGMEFLEPLLYYSLIAGAHFEKQEPPKFKREEMELILDECFEDFLKIVEKFYPPKEVDRDQAGSTEKKLGKGKK